MIKPTIEGMMSIIRSCAKAKTVKKLIFTNSAGTLNVEQHQKPVYDETNWSDLDFILSTKMTGWVSLPLSLSLLRLKREEHNIITFTISLTSLKTSEKFLFSCRCILCPRFLPRKQQLKQLKRTTLTSLASYHL